jgi:putative endonuclease
MLIFSAYGGKPPRGTLRRMTLMNRIVGGFGECAAARHLVGQGLAVLDRNWFGAGGELDVVARDGPDLVIGEVKTRRAAGFGLPVEAVGPAKARRLRRLAVQWLRDTRRFGPRDIRFDVVSVVLRGPHPRVEHLVRAF